MQFHTYRASRFFKADLVWRESVESLALSGTLSLLHGHASVYDNLRDITFVKGEWNDRQASATFMNPDWFMDVHLLFAMVAQVLNYACSFTKKKLSFGTEYIYFGRIFHLFNANADCAPPFKSATHLTVFRFPFCHRASTAEETSLACGIPFSRWSLIWPCANSVSI